MIIKALEIRDEGTKISMFAIKVFGDNEAQRAVCRDAGYGDSDNLVILLGAHDCQGHYSPNCQRGHTRQIAHQFIREHFDELKDGDVVDVEFITGRRPAPKESEIQKNYSDAAWKLMNERARQ